VTEKSDDELMQSVAQGDQAAFGVLLRRHVDALYTYANRLGQSPGLAEDLVQETWLAAWQHARRFNPRKAKLTTWLHRILHNKFIDFTRKSRVQYDDNAVATALDTFNADDTEQNRQSSALLEALIAQLPQDQKAAIVLTHVQGFGNRDVAQILGKGLRATESLLATARNNLKTAFNQQTSEQLSR